MHELGLLTSVVRAAEDAGRQGNGSVVKVVLRVGTLSGASPEALIGAWPIAAAGTLVEGAELVLEEVAAAVWCPACDAEREIDAFYALRCPTCANPTADLVRGRELTVVYVELEVSDHTSPPQVG